jgi:hypothetical protein
LRAPKLPIKKDSRQTEQKTEIATQYIVQDIVQKNPDRDADQKDNEIEISTTRTVTVARLLGERRVEML